MSLQMMHFEYCGIGNSLTARTDYPDGVLAEIRQRTEEFNIWPWGEIENHSPLMEEIADNLAFRPADSREIYAEELVCKMQTWTWLYSLSKEKLDAVSNSIKLYSIEMYFRKWRNAFTTFVEHLAVILAKLGINILEIQNQCGVYIIERLEVKELWTYFGTYESAEHHLSRIGSTKKENKKKVGRPKSSNISFYSLLIGNDSEKEATLKILHNHIDGKKGRYVALVINTCVVLKKLCKPSFSVLKSEFNLSGSRQGFDNYYGNFKQNELNLMKTIFEK